MVKFTPEQRVRVQALLDQQNAATGSSLTVEDVERVVQGWDRVIDWQGMERLAVKARLYWPIKMGYRRGR